RRYVGIAEAPGAPVHGSEVEVSLDPDALHEQQPEHERTHPQGVPEPDGAGSPLALARRREPTDDLGDAHGGDEGEDLSVARDPHIPGDPEIEAERRPLPQ